MSREKQIEEMSVDLSICLTEFMSGVGDIYTDYDTTAQKMYNKGYRKQSEGCCFCGTPLYVKTVQHTMPLLAPITRADELRHELLNLTGEIYLPIEAKFCPMCGAKMKGGAE